MTSLHRSPTKEDMAYQFMRRNLKPILKLGQYAIIDGSTWYGPYETHQQACDAFGKTDSLGMKIEGLIKRIE